MLKNSLVKTILIEGFLALLILIIPFFGFIFIPWITFGYWLLSLGFIFAYRIKNKEKTKSLGYLKFEKYTFFQVITWSFAYFIYIEPLMIIGLSIPFVLLILGIKKEIRSSRIYQRWTKFTGMLLVTLAIILFLITRFPDVGEIAFVTIPMIVLINSMFTALYLKVEHAFLPGFRRSIVFILVMLMMVSTIVTLYPHEAGLTLMEQIFGY